MTNIAELITHILKQPEELGRLVGFKDLTLMHGEWIREMINGEGDYTLQAHRGSYKSSCLAVAISMLMIFRPTKNIIFCGKRTATWRRCWGWWGKSCGSR